MTNLIPVLTACPPRPIRVAGEQFAADLLDGIRGQISTPVGATEFLDSTYLTRSTAEFLKMVTDRLRLGKDSHAPSIYQMYSRYGGGKTHGLLMLAASAMHPALDYWHLNTDADPVSAKIIAFDGVVSNVLDGLRLDDQNNRAKSLSGYILYQLGGPEALQQFRQGDDRLTDPGSQVFQELIGEHPTLIIIDELVQYINKVQQRIATQGGATHDGLLTTISALVSAVANSPKAVLVITTPEQGSKLLSESAEPTATGGDAFQADALILRTVLDRVESQLARQINPIVPSDLDDLPEILRKRLFHHVDDSARQETSNAYAQIATRNGRATERLSQQKFVDSYPFHPSLLEIITSRMTANTNFQRVRGTLRLLSYTLQEMQRTNDPEALIHPFHVTPAAPNIRMELINRTAFMGLDPAIDTDVVGIDATVAKLGIELAQPVANTMLMGTIAPDASSGLYADDIADAILSPDHQDYGLITNAINTFLGKAIYVDDTPSETRLRRFSREANVMKELNEARETLLANTGRMEELLRAAIRSAYSGPTNSPDSISVELYPTKTSNLPDDHRRACVGIINPDHWNWADADNSANGMSNQDILQLHRHSSNDNGEATRQYPNNAILLAAHDSNLTRIRQSIATMEAADLLLKDPSRNLPEHRRAILQQEKADAEKNATTDIQNKWTHLFSAGNSAQHQWPEPNSHLEHRTLESFTDAVGKGQQVILNTLGDRALRGNNAALNKNVWARIAIIARSEGATLGELHEYFGRTPNERIVINEQTWMALIQNGMQGDALEVVTTTGEINPQGQRYDANWQVWAKGHRPSTPEPTPPDPPPGPPEPPGPPPPAPTPTKSFSTGKTVGRAAYESVRRFVEDNQLDWGTLKSCQVTGTKPALADQIASIAQGEEEGIFITLRAQNEKVRVEVLNGSPSEYKEYATPAKRMLARAAITDVDVSVRLDALAAHRVLERLNNQDEANVRVEFE